MKTSIFLILFLTFSLLFIKAQTQQDFIHTNGKYLVHGQNNDTIYLRGINFNNFWLDDGSPNWIFDDPTDNGIPQPYAFGDVNWFIDAKQIGFNVIRMALNYRLFEDNANPYTYNPSGWAFIDQYIHWADSLNMYLILDMHIPQGGLQNATNAPQLWMNQSNQNRLVSLWVEIAQRYSNDTIIAAFDLLNEPTPVDSIAAWSNLAQRIADTIRTVDNNHLLIVEYAYGIIDTTNTWYPFWNLSQQMFFISDSNVMYDFHYYNPLSYTLQCYNNTGCTPTIQYNDTGVVFPTENGNTLPFTQAWLSDDLSGMMTVYQAANVPINIGEWAPWRANYEYNNNQMQGYEYICNLLQLFEQNDLHWQFYCYNEFRDSLNGGNQGLNNRLSNYFLSGNCDNSTSIDNNYYYKDHILIYPNPSNGNFTIKLPKNTKTDYITIANITGQIINIIPLKNKQTIYHHTSKLSSGIYLIGIYQKRKTIVKRLVVTE